MHPGSRRGMRMVAIAGAGGFIGGHLVRSLIDQGESVTAVDSKPLDESHQVWGEAENLELDLRQPEACDRAVAGADAVYNMAADMGGMGFIEGNKALWTLSVLINTHLLQAAAKHDVERFF